MSGKRSRGKRISPEMIRHMVDNQLEPQLAAAQMREQGVPVDVAMVSVDPNAEGFVVTCRLCGKTARMATDPGVKVAVCPACMREHGMLGES